MPIKINISQERKKLIIYLLLTVVTFAVYWQANQYDFINYDDQVYVTENLSIQSGITPEGVRWAFSTKYFGLWNPLVWLSLMLDYQLFGLKAGGYHLTNLIFHILSTLLLFWLFHRMTRSVWKSAFVSAFFALHPMHVESVAWIAERKDVLSAFFWMLTLCLYVYYVERPILRRYLAALFSFILALMSKPMVVTLPVIMILLDYWPLNRFKTRKENLLRWQLKEKIPFFILSAGVSFLTLYAPNTPHVGYYSFAYRVENAIESSVIYLVKTFSPGNLAAFYPFPTQISEWQFIGVLLVVMAITFFVFLRMKELPFLFVGWLWYAITIFPVIGLIQIGSYAMADRYHYLPSIGVAIILAWGAPAMFRSEEIAKKILIPAGTAFIFIMMFLSWKQCGYWKNSSTLFNHALQVTENNYLAHNGLGLALFDENKIAEAIRHYSEAVRIRPDFYRPYHNRAVAYAALGDYKRAIDGYDEAIRLEPGSAESYNNRGIVFSLTGQQRRAIEDYNEALRLKPGYFEVHNNRGLAYSELGYKERAIEEFNNAIHLKPDQGIFYTNRAAVYFYQKKNELGCHDAQKSCNLGNCAILKDAKLKGYCR